jgi:hypothetical protein
MDLSRLTRSRQVTEALESLMAEYVEASRPIFCLLFA